MHRPKPAGPASAPAGIVDVSHDLQNSGDTGMMTKLRCAGFVSGRRLTMAPGGSAERAVGHL